jgi:oxygen-dependent protoporphyrinogen oxidase
VTRVAVVGGGIAGLAVALAVRRRMPEAELTVLEAAPRPGGNIRSERVDGYLCEWGPNGFLDRVPETLALVREPGSGRAGELPRERPPVVEGQATDRDGAPGPAAAQW